MTEGRALIGLGANLGDPAGQVAEAVRRLSAHGRVAAVSGLYRTAPVGPVAQPDFLNAVCLLTTRLAPTELLERMQAIERELGRTRELRWGPRTLDLDLLDFDGRVHRDERLMLPHPELAARAFVLVPLAEIVPEWRHPTLGCAARELLAALGSPGEVDRVGELDWMRDASHAPGGDS